jgi:hypothetical protein
MADCEHMYFAVSANIARLTASEGGPVTGFVAEIHIVCKDCGKPFQFLGLEPGFDSQGARVSLDGLEANLAITPAGTKPNPFQRMAYSIGSNFDA